MKADGTRNYDARTERRLTARYVKNASTYRHLGAFSSTIVVDDAADTRDTYINADIEYKAADSVMISAAKRGCFEAPGIRDTKRIRVTMMMVETVVVATDNAIPEIWTALAMCGGIQTGHTEMTKYAMPVAESNVRL